MRYFIDTEFIETSRKPPQNVLQFPEGQVARQHPVFGELYLISIGIVAEDGREFYAATHFPKDRAGTWLQENVLPQLPPEQEWFSPHFLARELRTFITNPTEFWGYYSAYDWVLFCWAMGGRMIDLPAKWPAHMMDLKQSMVEQGISKAELRALEGTAHNALHDARWHKKVWEYIYT